MSFERQRRANNCAQIDYVDLWRDTDDLRRQVEQLTRRLDEFVNKQPRDRCARRNFSEPQYQFFEEFSVSSTEVIVSNFSYDLKDLFTFDNEDDNKSANWDGEPIWDEHVDEDSEENDNNLIVWDQIGVDSGREGERIARNRQKNSPEARSEPFARVQHARRGWRVCFTLL